MIVFLTGIGLITSAVFAVSGDVWATLAVHSGLAMIGVLGALEDAGRLDAFTTWQPLTLATALLAAAALAQAHRGAVLSSRSARS